MLRKKANLTTEYNEEELVCAAQSGDREAFASLYEANVDRVFHYLLRRMGQPADAEDVTAEVFIRAMEAIHTFQFRGPPFIAWLLRIAHNTAVNNMKKQSRRKEQPLLDTVSESDDPADLAMRQAVSEEVTTAMKGLTALQREVITHRYLGELSVAETANKMDRSLGAVKFLQHSALQALQRILNRQEAGTHEK